MKFCKKVNSLRWQKSQENFDKSIFVKKNFSTNTRHRNFIICIVSTKIYRGRMGEPRTRNITFWNERKNFRVVVLRNGKSLYDIVLDVLSRRTHMHLVVRISLRSTFLPSMILLFLVKNIRVSFEKKMCTRQKSLSFRDNRDLRTTYIHCVYSYYTDRQKWNARFSTLK